MYERIKIFYEYSVLTFDNKGHCVTLHLFHSWRRKAQMTDNKFDWHQKRFYEIDGINYDDADWYLHFYSQQNNFIRFSICCYFDVAFRNWLMILNNVKQILIGNWSKQNLFYTQQRSRNKDFRKISKI